MTYKQIIVNVASLDNNSPDPSDDKLIAHLQLLLMNRMPMQSMSYIRPLKLLTVRIPVNKEQYKSFLRLNDRKKSQISTDIDKVGYPKINLEPYLLVNNRKDIEDWCKNHLGLNGFIYSSRYIEYIWFKSTDDLIAFKMRFA